MTTAVFYTGADNVVSGHILSALKLMFLGQRALFKAEKEKLSHVK